MSVDTGTFITAQLTNNIDGLVYVQDLKHAKCMVVQEAVLVTHYKSEDKSPDSKRTIVLNPNTFISFVGHGFGK